MERSFLKRHDWIVDYFRISGRITRGQYILRVIGRYVIFTLAIILLILALFCLLIFFEYISSASPSIYNILEMFVALLSVFLTFILLVLSIIFKYAQEIKRLYDMNYSGWFILIGFIPFINIVYYIILIFKDGTVGPNKYGPDPKNRIVDAEN